MLRQVPHASPREAHAATVPYMSKPDPSNRVASGLWTMPFLLLPAACDSSPQAVAPAPPPPAFGCAIPEDQIFAGGPGRDGIPALTDPAMATPDTDGGDYLAPGERVVGILLDGEAIAIPHRVLWLHEIVNLNVRERRVAVTYCPLTGSSMAFDRSTVGGAEFGVSGLLYLNNLIMYDRGADSSLWPQMARGARCGNSTGIELPMLPAADMTWEGWTDLHPDTKVPAHNPAIGQSYASYRYPYGDYEVEDNPGTLFPMPSVDTRRPPKERVFGIPGGGGSEAGGIAFPLGELRRLGAIGVAAATVGGRAVAVFWNGDGDGALAFHPRAGGRELNFTVRDGAIVDRETGSRWTVEGTAVAGMLAGAALDPIPEGYVAFWFAWAAFHPGGRIWEF